MEEAMIRNKNIQIKISLLITITISVLLASCGAGGAAGGPATDVLCPAVNYEDGAVVIDQTEASGTSFTSALLGTYDRLDTGHIAGGMDWFSTESEEFSTTSMGTQLISWWSEKGSRTTELQVTNHSGSHSVSIHIQIFKENCLESLDFCDQLAPFDTHVYDFSNLVTKTGHVISSSGLSGEEGFVVITPSVNCAGDLRATSFSFLSGNTKVSDTTNGFQYGMNVWARDADTATSCTDSVAGRFKILTGIGNCRLNPVLPSEISQVFSKTTDSDASRSDLVFITIADNYSPSYIATGGSTTLSPIIINTNEVQQSCAPRTACYLRVGLNDAIKDSDDPLPAPGSGSLCDASAPGAIIGTPGDDTLSGTGADNVIIGLGGNDTITGGGGADCIDGGPGNDIINAGSGGDTVYGGTGNDDIEGRGGMDEIHGNAGDDMISGGGQADMLFGEEGADTIEGGAGADNLDGGAGIDNLDGGGGSDTCVNGEALTSC